MTVEVKYRCDICQYAYGTQEGAEACEAKGVFDFSKYPIGLLKKQTWEEGRYGIFALAVHEHRYSKHYGAEVMWAYRSWEVLSNDIIDINGFGRCGNGSELYFEDWNNSLTDEDLELRETKWLIRQLQANGITPSYYRNGELIHIKEDIQ